MCKNLDNAAQLPGFRCRFVGMSNEGSLPEIAQYGSYYLPLNVFTASELSLYILSNIYADISNKKVQVGKDQEKAKSEKDSHSKYRGGKNLMNNHVLIP